MHKPAVTTDLQTRSELIALSQLIALNLDTHLFQTDEPVIIILNGSGNSGKSLIPTAFSAQLMDIRTSNLDVIGETTWISDNIDTPAPMRLHFIDAAEVCENPYDLMKTEDGQRKDFAALKKELKGKGDVIFLQNVPHEFRDFSDMEMILSRIDSFGDWDRLITIMVHNERVMGEKMTDFFQTFGPAPIKKAAQQIPNDYLLPDGRLYGPVLQG